MTAFATISPIDEELACLLTDATTIADENREKARDCLRVLVGDRVYASRRPQSIGDQTAVTIRRIGGVSYYGLLDEDCHRHTVLQLDIWGTHKRDVSLAADYLDIVISNWFGANWGSTPVNGCTQERVWSELATAVTDGSDDWVFRLSSDWMVLHEKTIASNEGAVSVS